MTSLSGSTTSKACANTSWCLSCRADLVVRLLSGIRFLVVEPSELNFSHAPKVAGFEPMSSVPSLSHEPDDIIVQNRVEFSAPPVLPDVS